MAAIRAMKCANIHTLQMFKKKGLHNLYAGRSIHMHLKDHTTLQTNASLFI